MSESAPLHFGEMAHGVNMGDFPHGGGTLYQAALDGQCGRGSTGGNAQPVEGVAQVAVHGFLAERKFGGNLAVGQPGGDMTQHLDLAGS